MNCVVWNLLNGVTVITRARPNATKPRAPVTYLAYYRFSGTDLAVHVLVTTGFKVPTVPKLPQASSIPSKQ